LHAQIKGAHIGASDDFEDLRKKVTTKIEEELKTLIESLEFIVEAEGVNEEFNRLKKKQMVSRNLDDEKRLDFLKNKLQVYVGNPEQEQAEDEEENKADYYFNTEEDKPYIARKAQKIALTLRSRLLLANLCCDRGVLKAFYIVRQTLINFANFGTGKRIEKESEIKNIFGIPSEFYEGGSEVNPGGKDKGDQDKKQKGKDKDKQEEDEEEIAFRKKEEEEEERKEMFRIAEKDRNEFPCAYLWLIARYQYIQLLYKQARFDEATFEIENAKAE
jgi:hypothetical protein